MRPITPAEYSYAKRVLAAYTEYCKPYVQRNGWTCIPANAIRFAFEGHEFDTSAINELSTVIELRELFRDSPFTFSAYVVGDKLTTWTGEVIGRVLYRGPRHTNNMGGRWCAISVETEWKDARGFCTEYHGREYESRQLVNLTKTNKRERA